MGLAFVTGEKAASAFCERSEIGSPSGGTATLSFVADSFYTLDILTPGGRCFNITFARIDNSVKWMDVS